MRKNFSVVDGVEYCDYSFMFMTGGMGPEGLDYEQGGEWIDWTEEGLIIGWLDAPDKFPAGAMEFIDNPMMCGIFAQVASRD